jgi:hypothetical protein
MIVSAVGTEHMIDGDSDRVLSERAVGSNNLVAADFNPPLKKQMIVSAVGTEHMIDGAVL